MAVGRRRHGTRLELLGVFQAALELADHRQHDQRIRVQWVEGQGGSEILVGFWDLLGLHGVEAPQPQPSALVRQAALVLFALGQHLRVRGTLIEVGLQLRLRPEVRALPKDRLPPGPLRGGANPRLLGQGLQAIDCFWTGALPVGQQLGVGELGPQVLRVVLHDLAKPSTRGVELALQAFERHVVLDGEVCRRRVALERSAVGVDGALLVARLRQAPCFPDGFGVRWAVLDGLLQRGDARILRMRRLQPLQRGGSLAGQVLIDVDLHQHGQRVGIARVQLEQALQAVHRLAGLVGTPVGRLAQQGLLRLDRTGARPLRMERQAPLCALRPSVARRLRWVLRHVLRGRVLLRGGGNAEGRCKGRRQPEAGEPGRASAWDGLSDNHHDGTSSEQLRDAACATVCIMAYMGVSCRG